MELVQIQNNHGYLNQAEALEVVRKVRFRLYFESKGNKDFLRDWMQSMRERKVKDEAKNLGLNHALMQILFIQK